VRRDPSLVWLVAFAIVAELAAAVFLIARQNSNFTLPGDRAARPSL
jgi:hypothetical protein